MKIYICTKICSELLLAALLELAPELEAAKMYLNGWVVKQTMVYPYNGILLSNKKK
jgi:hypothetical protein